MGRRTNFEWLHLCVLCLVISLILSWIGYRLIGLPFAILSLVFAVADSVSAWRDRKMFAEMRLTLLQGLLKNLKGEIPEHMRREHLSKEMAHQRLIEVTGQQFAMDDIDAWTQWIKDHPRGRSTL